MHFTLGIYHILLNTIRDVGLEVGRNVFINDDIDCIDFTGFTR